MTVYGAVLHPSRGVQRVYAPAVAPLPVIQPWKQTATVRVTSVDFGLQSIENLSPLFRNCGAKDLAQKRSFALMRTTGDDSMARSLAPLDIDEGIKKVRLEPEGPSPRIMAVGPKSSGKSTFNRLLCNMITSRAGKAKSRCLYLDLDPGQPEFGPPGQLALVEVTAPVLGPPFTHAASARSTAYRIIRSHTIAATSFKDDPEHYIACAVDLVNHAAKDVPIVVNSCGWVSNLGASTMVALASKLAITELVSHTLMYRDCSWPSNKLEGQQRFKLKSFADIFDRFSLNLSTRSLRMSWLRSQAVSRSVYPDDRDNKHLEHQQSCAQCKP